MADRLKSVRLQQGCDLGMLHPLHPVWLRILSLLVGPAPTHVSPRSTEQVHRDAVGEVSAPSVALGLFRAGPLLGCARFAACLAAQRGPSLAAHAALGADPLRHSIRNVQASV